MIPSDFEHLPGRTVARHVGLVQGSPVRAKHVGRDIGASIKTVFNVEYETARIATGRIAAMEVLAWGAALALGVTVLVVSPVWGLRWFGGVAAQRVPFEFERRAVERVMV